MGNSQRDLLKPKNFVVLPDDSLKMIWDSVMLVFIITTSITTPFWISFYGDSQNLSMVSYNYFVDLLFAVDIVFNFYQGFYDDSYEIVIDRGEIARHYVHGWFFYDMASNFSLLMLIPSFQKSAWLKFLRIVRVFRIAKLVKDSPAISKLFQDMLKVGAGVERLFFFLIASIILTHFMACLWYF